MGYATYYDPDTDIDRWYTDATASSICNWIRDEDSVLELGAATGRMTAALASRARFVTAVEREPVYLERAAERNLPNVSWHCNTIEEAVGALDALQGDVLAPMRGFDHVVVANVLHELVDPVSVLAAARSKLAPSGLLHLSLQNPTSIHRLIGFATGQIDELTAVSDRGAAYETLRIYDIFQLRSIGRAAGLIDIHCEGIMCKPVTNAGLDGLEDSVLEGFVAAGRLLGDLAAMNYLIFKAAPEGIR